MKKKPSKKAAPTRKASKASTIDLSRMKDLLQEERAKLKARIANLSENDDNVEAGNVQDAADTATIYSSIEILRGLSKAEGSTLQRIEAALGRLAEGTYGTCERCGGPIHRLLSAAPFILKGGGWYVTDYPSESRKKANESTSKESTSKESASKESASKQSTSKESTSKGDGGSAESKPAASSESKSSTESRSSSASSTSKPAAGS